METGRLDQVDLEAALDFSERECLGEMDEDELLLIVGWAYLRKHLRQAIVTGNLNHIAPLSQPAVLARLRSAAKHELPSESPALQFIAVDWLDEDNVLYTIREAERSALSIELCGSLYLEVTISCANRADWRLRDIRFATGPDPDRRVLDSCFA